MSDRIHGHSPRVRRRKNRQTGSEPDSEIVISKENLINLTISSAIGTVVGTAINRAIAGSDG